MWHSSDASVAEQMLEKAIELAPDFAAAHAALTNYLVSGWLEPEDARWGNPTTLDHAWRSACAAIESDAYLPAAHAAMGWVQFWRHEPDIAIDCYRRAQELNPSFADGHYGHVLSVAGFPKEGHQALLRTRLLDPFHPPMLLGGWVTVICCWVSPTRRWPVCGNAQCLLQAGDRLMSGVPPRVPNWAWPTRHAPR